MAEGASNCFIVLPSNLIKPASGCLLCRRRSLAKTQNKFRSETRAVGHSGGPVAVSHQVQDAATTKTSAACATKKNSHSTRRDVS